MISPKAQFWIDVAADLTEIVVDVAGIPLDKLEAADICKTGHRATDHPYILKVAAILALRTMWITTSYQDLAKAMGVMDGRAITEARDVFLTHRTSEVIALAPKLKAAIGARLAEWIAEWKDVKAETIEFYRRENAGNVFISEKDFHAGFKGRRFEDDERALTEKHEKIRLDKGFLSPTSCALTWG